MEQGPIFKIEEPHVGDENALAPMHIQSWKETYVTPDSGLTEPMVDEMIGHMLTNTNFRKNTIIEALAHPDLVLYRVVKNSEDKIVGFLHASKAEDFNELEGIYLLDEAKGSGTGKKLMEEFLAWIDKSKPCRLEIFSFNNRAFEFYTKYGFVKTDKPAQIYKGKLPFVEMVRPAENVVKS